MVNFSLVSNLIYMIGNFLKYWKVIAFLLIFLWQVNLKSFRMTALHCTALVLIISLTNIIKMRSGRTFFISLTFFSDNIQIRLFHLHFQVKRGSNMAKQGKNEGKTMQCGRNGVCNGKN